jgi:cytidine deaminase
MTAQPHRYHDLIARARQAGEQAYVPYSHYPVGAALLTGDGRIFTGCNIENASYPACICAERVALVKAVSEGVRAFQALAVTTRDGGTPCGVCRQMLSEFGVDFAVVIADADGRITFEGTLADLLPHNFSASSLDR